MTFMGLFKALTLAATAALTILLLVKGSFDTPGSWFLFIPFWLWIVGPHWVPYWAAKHFKTRINSISFGLLFVASGIFCGWIYYQALFESRSSTDSLILIFIPFYQWVILITVVTICQIKRHFTVRRS